jgi:tRNA1(Val) A37 N6-methylase TrmN6
MGEVETTEDALLGGRIRIRQPARGYRVNVDTMLLAAALPAANIGDGPVVEVGCGVGAALLAVAKGCEAPAGRHFIGIERDPLYARLARENVALNGLADCVRIIQADALDPPADLGQFARVFFNPPYDDPGEGRAPAPERQAAYVAERPIGDWIKVWSNRMSAHANLTLIHRAHRLGDILAALEGRLGGAEIYPIRPTARAKARRVIVRAWKGSRAPLKLFAGLDLHPDDASEKYTPQAEAILRGEQHIFFG